MPRRTLLAITFAITLPLSFHAALAGQDSPLRAGNADDKVNVAGQWAPATQFLPAEAMPPIHPSPKPVHVLAPQAPNRETRKTAPTTPAPLAATGMAAVQ